MHRHKRRDRRVIAPLAPLLAGLLVCSTLSTSAIFAQSEVTTPDVEVIGHYDNAVGSSNAASEGVVNATLIGERPLLRSGEILEFVPGLIVTQHSGTGKANQYFLRGFNLDHGTDFGVYMEDMPINMRSHGHGQGYADANFVIPELVTRIDYRKGPYYADEGDFSTAGSAHFRLYDKLPDNIMSTTLGTDRYVRALLAHSPEIVTGNLTYGLEWTGYDGPWTNSENLRKLNGVLRYAYGDARSGFNLMGMAYRANWDSTDQIPRRAIASGAIDRFGAIDPTDGGETARYSLSGAWHQAIGDGQLRVDAYAIKYDLDLWSNFTYFLTDEANGDQFQQVDHRKIYGGQVSYAFPLAWNELQLENRVGLQTRHDDIGKVALYQTIARRFLSSTRDDRIRESSIALFADNSIQWTTWLRSMLGIRTDLYRFNVASNNAANSGSHTAHITSPKAGLVLGPWNKTEFFLNYGYGFHSNDARGTTITVDPATGAPANQVTPLVRTKGGEIGMRTELFDGVQTSLALWQLKVDSELLFVGDAGSTEASRPSSRYGVEWITAWRPTSWLLLDLDVDLSKAKFTDGDSAGNHIPGAIERALQLGIYLNNLGPWSAGLQIRHFGPRALIEDNSVRSASTTMTNMRIGYETGRKWQAHLDVLNLFNRRDSDIEYFYESRLSGEPSGVATADVHFHPVESRQYRLSIAIKF